MYVCLYKLTLTLFLVFHINVNVVLYIAHASMCHFNDQAKHLEDRFQPQLRKIQLK